MNETREQMQAVIEETRALFPEVNFPNVRLDPVYHGYPFMQNGSLQGIGKLDGRFAIITERDGEQSLAEFATQDYQLVTHEYAIARMLQAIEKMPEYGEPKLFIQFPDGIGHKMHVRARFPSVDFPIGNDQLNPQVCMTNSYDKGWTWGYTFGAMVLRCTNGLLMFKAIAKSSQKHILGMDVESHVAQLSVGMTALSEQKGIWQNWVQLQLNSQAIEEVVNELPLSDKQKEKVLLLPETGTGVVLQNVIDQREKVSAWTFNSVLTQFATHELRESVAKVNTQEQLAEAFRRAMAKRN